MLTLSHPMPPIRPILPIPLTEQDQTAIPSASARASQTFRAAAGRPLFLADWTGALMLHYEVEARILQPCIPLELDRYQNRAYVSVVAFRQERLRPAFGGKLAQVLSAPFASHAFLNLRTYVRAGDERGIFFMAEWIPNFLARLVGPRLYGLPYRLGRLEYRYGGAETRLEGTVEARGSADGLTFRARVSPAAVFLPAASGSESEFLMERYTAFTLRKGQLRRFRIWHVPWPQASAEVQMEDRGLLGRSGAWFKHAKPAGANFSPGVRGVWIGGPQRVPCMSRHYEALSQSRRKSPPS